VDKSPNQSDTGRRGSRVSNAQDPSATAILSDDLQKNGIVVVGAEHWGCPDAVISSIECFSHSVTFGMNLDGLGCLKSHVSFKLSNGRLDTKFMCP